MICLTGIYFNSSRVCKREVRFVFDAKAILNNYYGIILYFICKSHISVIVQKLVAGYLHFCYYGNLIHPCRKLQISYLLKQCKMFILQSMQKRKVKQTAKQGLDYDLTLNLQLCHTCLQSSRLVKYKTKGTKTLLK